MGEETILLHEKLASLREEKKTEKQYALVKYGSAFLLMAAISGGQGYKAGYKAGNEAGYQLTAVTFNERGASLVGDNLVLTLNRDEAENVGNEIGRIFFCKDDGTFPSGAQCETQATIQGREVKFRTLNAAEDVPPTVEYVNEANTDTFLQRLFPSFFSSRHVGSKHGHRRSRKYMHRPKRRLVPDPPTIESCGDRHLSTKFALHARVAKR